MQAAKKRTVVAIALAAVFTLLMGATAFATTSTYVTQVSQAQYTTFLSQEEGGVTSTTLYATSTSNWADNHPFTTSTEAEAVEWGFTDDGYTISSTTESSDSQLVLGTKGSVSSASSSYTGPTPQYAASEAGYYATITVSINDDADEISAGTYSIMAKIGDYNYCNFTVAIEEDGSASNVVVKVRNGIAGTTLLGDTPITSLDIMKYYDSTIGGRCDVLQSTPSALSTIGYLKHNNLISAFTISGSGAYSTYINSINGVTAAGYNGWLYGVYREVNGTYTLQPLSTVVAAGSFPLQSGDKVLWLYGSWGSIPSTYPSDY